MNANFQLDDQQRQTTLMALALLSLAFPDQDEKIAAISDAFAGRKLFEAFKAYRCGAKVVSRAAKAEGAVMKPSP